MKFLKRYDTLANEMLIEPEVLNENVIRSHTIPVSNNNILDIKYSYLFSELLSTVFYKL